MHRIVVSAEAMLTNTSPAILHADFNLTNIHYHNNRINGIYDFEWARVGDRALDFCKLNQYFVDFPSMQAPCLAGYTTHLPLPDNLKARTSLYDLLYALLLLNVSHQYSGQEAFTFWMRKFTNQLHAYCSQ